MSNPDVQRREELAAVLEARRELGQEYEPALVESFIDRLNQAIDARVDANLAGQRGSGKLQESFQRAQFQVAIASLGVGIPITAIAGGKGGLGGMALAWGGIAAVNVAHSLSNRWQRGRR
jgi:hypothetical protein